MKYACRLAIWPIVLFGGMMTTQAQNSNPKYEMTVSKALYDSIVALDSVFFDAYNRCRIDIMDSLMSENLEFYHDRGGYSNSKKQTMDAVKKNICGKVSRELLAGSIEVYEISGYGAVEMGFHGFRNNQEKSDPYFALFKIRSHLEEKWEQVANYQGHKPALKKVQTDNFLTDSVGYSNW